MGQGAAGTACGEGGGRVREAARRRGRGARRARGLPGLRAPGAAACRGVAGEGRRDRSRLRVLEVDALGRQRASLLQAGAMDVGQARRRDRRRRFVVRPPLRGRRRRDPCRRGVRGAPPRGARGARRGGAAATDRLGARRDRGVERPGRRARGGRVPRRECDGARGTLRRALPPTARARGRDGDAVAPALLPAWREPVRVRRQRRRSGHGAGR